MIEPPLQDFELRIETARTDVTKQTQPLAVSLKGGLGDEANELGADGGGAVAASLFLNGSIDFADGGAGEVGDVHGDLGLAVGGNAHGFDAGQASAGLADILGDGAGYGDFRGVEVEVEGDEEAARAHSGGSGGGMERGTADVGPARRFAKHCIAQAFKLAAADLFEHCAVRTGGGGFVEIDGDLIAFPDFSAGLAREQRALLEGDVVDGDGSNDD